MMRNFIAISLLELFHVQIVKYVSVLFKDINRDQGSQSYLKFLWMFLLRHFMPPGTKI